MSPIFLYSRDIWIRTQIAAVANKRATNLATHLHYLLDFYAKLGLTFTWHFFTDADSDLDNIIEEVDEDGSGTLDFDEFMEMMAG